MPLGLGNRSTPIETFDYFLLPPPPPPPPEPLPLAFVQVPEQNVEIQPHATTEISNEQSAEIKNSPRDLNSSGGQLSSFSQENEGIRKLSDHGQPVASHLPANCSPTR